ncbi:restriction endonuclease subunit S [Staphylococcus borealis]
MNGNPCILYGELYTKYGAILNKVYSKTSTQNDSLVFSKRNQILIPSSGETDIDIATATAIDTDVKIAIGGDLNIITPINSDGRFISLYINGKGKYNLAKYAQGKSVVHLYNSDIKKLNFYLPTNMVEQKKIGNFFSKLDRQIELEEEKLELLEQQKKGYMQKIFTQKLRFKDKTGNIYPNWKTTELKDILEKIIDNRGKTPDNTPSEKYPLLEVNALGYYHPSYKKVSKFVSEDTYNNWFREHLKENDILFSTVGNTGIVSLMDNYKAVIAQNIVGLRVNNNNIPSFVYYMLSYWENQKKIKRIQMGAVQPSVKVSQFKFIKYLIPIKDEQEKIANLLSEIDKVINKQLIKIEVLKQRKQGLLQKMFV